MKVIEKRNIYLTFSTTLIIASWILIAVFGLRAGIDLKGGTSWQIYFPDLKNTVHEDQIRSIFVADNVEAFVTSASDGSFIVRTKDLSEEDHQKYRKILIEKLGSLEEKSFSSIGPIIGSELKRKSIWAIFAVMVGISLYIAYAFRKVSGSVQSWKYGVITLMTLVHDVSIPAGLLALLGKWKGVEIDTNFIVALLFVMGFSVHDTIVVFDRVRENLLTNRGKINFGETINQSIKETFARSINTSFTLVLVLVALLFFGPATLFYFILTILVGTIFGTYSSIFIASPVLYLWGRGK
ncbi:MAG: protein translocase subunit SecF [Patescibacteria group bacterium]